MGDLSDTTALAGKALVGNPPLGNPLLGNTQLASQLLDAMGVPAWLHRPGWPLQTNAALRRLCGLQGGATAPADPLLLLVPEDRDAMAQASDECLWRSGEPPAQSARLLGADGSQRPVELSLRRLLLDGAPAMLATCQDLSDIQHVQTMLQGMGSLLRQIIDGAPVASFVVDRFHRVTHWNTACSRLTGCSAEQMIGSTEAWRAFYDQPRPLLADLIVDGVGEDQLASLHSASARPSALVAGAYEAEAFFPRFGPEGRWLGFTAAPLRDAQGLVIGAIETLQDVSQRRRTEAGLTQRLEQMVLERSAELAAHARVMDAFIDNAPIGVVYARQNQVRRSNRQMAEIFGPPGPGSVGHGFHLSPGDREQIRRITLPALTQGDTVHHEMWLHHASGRPIWVQLHAYTVDHLSREGGTWWMLQDRTEMRAAQEELRQRFTQLQHTNQQLEQAQNQLLQSDKMASIGQLAAGVAHEINNPVGFVSSNLHTLRQYVTSLLQLVDAYGACGQGSTAEATPAATRQLAQTLAAVELDYLKQDLPQLLDESAEGLARVKKIVQDLKDFSRVDQADWQLADLNAGLESTLNVVLHEVKYKADIVRRLGSLPLVQCLAGQLNQVFMNLIVNASQAISGHGVITLASGACDGWVWVQVDDTGAGMADAVQRRIFEPFYTTKAVGQGTGLGLSLSFSIVQRHGGVIQVRSQPGVGSQFRVWVPVARPVSGLATDAPDAAAAPPQPPPWD